MEPQPKTRVLIVDDDQTLCDMYAERLKAEGFEVVVANNGEEGVAKATQYMPNVILLDLMMPKVNGFNALEILKSTEATKDIPVLLLTALIQEENKRRGLQAGAEDYIIKSESMPGDVIVKIKTAVEKSKQAKARAAGTIGTNQPAQSSVGTPTPAGGEAPQPTPPVTPETSPSETQPQVPENVAAPVSGSPAPVSPTSQPPMEPYTPKAPSEPQPTPSQETNTPAAPLSTDTSSSPTPPPPTSEEPPMPPTGQI